MKRGLFIIMLFALCLHFNQARAQRYLPGMKGLQVTAGMAHRAANATAQTIERNFFISGRTPLII